MIFKDDQLIFMCFEYENNLIKKDFNKELIKRFANIHEVLNNKNPGDYHDLYVQSHILLLADVFKNFRNKCIEMYELDTAHFLSAPGYHGKHV